jgi:hypothetical protein
MPPTNAKSRKTTQKTAAVAADSAAGVPTSEYAIGEDVTHPQFGDGTVTDIESDKLTVKFADGRTKQIVDYYVKRGKKVASSRSSTGQTPPPPSEDLPATSTE